MQRLVAIGRYIFIKENFFAEGCKRTDWDWVASGVPLLQHLPKLFWFIFKYFWELVLKRCSTLLARFFEVAVCCLGLRVLITLRPFHCSILPFCCSACLIVPGR
jgi:hypothetical protein